jgi:hypothetical protein
MSHYTTTGPSYFPKELISMLKDFLVVETSRRLGLHTHGGEQMLKALPYFKSINWVAMAAGKLPSPYKVTATHPGDCSNFDKYAKPTVTWHGAGKDGYGDMFAGF